MSMCIELPAGVTNLCKIKEAEFYAREAMWNDVYCALIVILVMVVCFAIIALVRHLMHLADVRECKRNIRRDIIEQIDTVGDRTYVAGVEINSFKRKYFKFNAKHVDLTTERIYYYFNETGLPLHKIKYSITVGALK